MAATDDVHPIITIDLVSHIIVAFYFLTSFADLGSADDKGCSSRCLALDSVSPTVWYSQTPNVRGA